MKIVLRYDAKKNSFYLAPGECEQVPEGTIVAKSYCESAGFLPTKVVIDIPGGIADVDQATLIEALEAQRETLAARLNDLEMRLRAYEGQGEGNKPAGKAKK